MKGDKDSRNMKRWNKPEHKLTHQGGNNVDLLYDKRKLGTMGEATYRNREFLAEFRGNEAENETADSDASPEASGYHARLEIATRPFPSHESNNPATKGNFCSDVSKKKNGCDPGNTAFECLPEAALATCICPRVSLAIYTTGDWPKCPK